MDSNTIIDGTVDVSTILPSSNTIWQQANININECIYKMSLSKAIWQ